MMLVITGGTRTRRREVKRTAVRPHGQCLSELVQRQPCLLDPCYTYTSIVGNEAEAIAAEAVCIRSDGLIVNGKLLQSFTCPNLNLPQKDFARQTATDKFSRKKICAFFLTCPIEGQKGFL